MLPIHSFSEHNFPCFPHLKPQYTHTTGALDSMAMLSILFFIFLGNICCSNYWLLYLFVQWKSIQIFKNSALRFFNTVLLRNLFDYAQISFANLLLNAIEFCSWECDVCLFVFWFSTFPPTRKAFNASSVLHQFSL